MEQSAFVATGVPQLDLLLGGGIARNSLLLVAGAAGTGKTVLAAQIAFAAARRDERVLFVTAFSEPHDKLIAHLRAFDFFDANLIGDRIKLLNLQHQLAGSITEAGETIVREARAQRTRIIVLDGFGGISSSGQSALASHIFLYDLSAKLSLLSATTIITDHMAFDNHMIRSELTAVDGVVALSQELVGDHAIRMLQVVKQRGASPLIGRHSFQIDSAGIRCFPRQEALAAADERPLDDRRLRFGIPELDAMLGGGLTHSTNTVIAGATGVGKTVLSLHYVMEGIAQGERTLLVSFHENAMQLVYKGRLVGLDIQGALDSGMLEIRHYSIADLNVDLVAQELRERVAAGSVERLVVDGLNEIEIPLLETTRAHGFFASLIAFLRAKGVTACFTLEVDPLIGRELSFIGKGFASLASNVLLLRHSEVDGQLVRTIGVLKMRFSTHDQRVHPYSITAEGMRIGRAAPDTPRTRRRAAR